MATQRPEFSESGFAAGGKVSEAMIKALLAAPAESGPSPVFTIKLLGKDRVPIFECGDYEDILFGGEHQSVELLRTLFQSADVPFLIEKTVYKMEVYK